MAALGVFGLMLVVGGTVAGIIGYCRERRQWNGGICPDCGDIWQYFSLDSQGGLGFKCQNGHACWVSYRSVLRSGQEDWD